MTNSKLGFRSNRPDLVNCLSEYRRHSAGLTQLSYKGVHMHTILQHAWMMHEAPWRQLETVVNLRQHAKFGAAKNGTKG